MPDEIVWVDKILNPRSAVLTHNEAVSVLKNAKSWISRPRLKAPLHKPIGAGKKLTLAQQKDEYIQLQRMFIQHDEMKPIIEMQSELEVIEASKEVYKKAVEERQLFPDGLPRLKPSLLLKKDIVRSKKAVGNQVANKLAQIDKGAINKNALKKIMIDDDDDEGMVIKTEVDIDVEDSMQEPLAKKRRIIISDDEDENIESSMESKASIELLSFEPAESTLKLADNPAVFKEEFLSYSASLPNAPVTICFEATNNFSNVIAMTEEVNEAINDNETLTNVQFTENAIFGVFHLPKDDEPESAEFALQSYWLGETKSKQCTSIPLSISVEKSSKRNYETFLDDTKFCSKLLNSCDPDWDVSSLVGMDSDYRASDNDYLPKLSTLNSLFTADDIDLLQYQSDVAHFNESRVRERQRVQHPFVKVRPSINEVSSKCHNNAVMATKSSSLVNVMRRSTNPTKVIKEEGLENKNCIVHNTVIHEALKFLEKSKTAHRYQHEIKDAYKKLCKYPLTFLEKMNLIHTSPKDLPGMLCMLDDLGLRFSKDMMDAFEQECSTLFVPRKHRVKRNSTT